MDAEKFKPQELEFFDHPLGFASLHKIPGESLATTPQPPVLAKLIEWQAGSPGRAWSITQGEIAGKSAIIIILQEGEATSSTGSLRHTVVPIDVYLGELSQVADQLMNGLVQVQLKIAADAIAKEKP